MLITLPDGTGVKADDVLAVQVLDQSEDFADIGPRVRVETTKNQYVVACESSDQAVERRDALIKAVNAATYPFQITAWNPADELRIGSATMTLKREEP